jgi:SEC-C motif
MEVGVVSERAAPHVQMSAIGRNEPCPCGSGKKYKRCHGSINPEAAAEAVDIDRIIRLANMRAEARQKEIERQFGLGRPPLSFESNGYRLVAVGNEIQWSKKWKTFADFLMSYFKSVMGAEWGKAQLAKPRAEWSPIFEWYAQTCEYQKKILTPGVLQQSQMTGAACGVLWLTYGLYLLRHNAEVQGRLLSRLRDCDPVQIFGAVQEVLCAAAIIRAGFELKLEDETDGSTTHCEFVATSKLTKKSFSVEIKVCDPGRMEGQQGKSRTVKQLSHALSKAADHPRIVWIDLNRPSSTNRSPEEVLKGEMRRIQTQAPHLKVHGAPAPPAYIFLSNWPFRHQLSETTAINRTVLATGIGIPKMGENVPFYSLRELGDFREEHQDVFRLAKEFATMAVPDTLDGSLPSRAFGKPGTPLLIGERYLIPTEDGSERPAELLDGVVNPETQSATGVFRLDDGVTVLCSVPLSDDELAAYHESPETFFGEYKPQNRVNHPVELYEWLLSVHKKSPRDTLLGLLKTHPQFVAMKDLPQDELVKIFADAQASAMAAKMRWDKTAL